MLNIGIIGAGTVSDRHIEAYNANPDSKVLAIADLNTSLVSEKAKKYGIDTVYGDYHELLADDRIDAAVILVPTFMHKSVTIEALRAGKHVFCEKPPALNADEVRECIAEAEKSGKLLMYGLVCRFMNHAQYMKEYIDSGKMGQIVFAECQRLVRCSNIGGWFQNKKKAGGGIMFDGIIHELDLAMYLMGYPKPISVTGSMSYINRDLNLKLAPPTDSSRRYTSSDTEKYEDDIETTGSAYVTLENGAYIYLKAGSKCMAKSLGVWMEICGENAGAKINQFTPGKEIELVEITEDHKENSFTPKLENIEPFRVETKHFVDCCLGRAECIVKPEEAETLMKIICAAYESASCGKTIYF